MININNLLSYYPDHLQKPDSRMAILKEYLQCKVLNIIYNGSWSKNLILIGGTCLRLLYDFRRFSDDLDFDFHGNYDYNSHRELCEKICTELNKEGIETELDNEKRKNEIIGAMTEYINFPGILYKQQIDPNPKKKLYLKIDAQFQNTGTYRYVPESKLINKFEVVRMIKAAPLSVIFSMKLCAAVSRAKGRDFYDVMELVNMVKPDIEFLFNRLANREKPIILTSPEQLKNLILESIKNINWNEKISEVSKFLHDKQEIDKVKYFKDFIIQLDIAKLFQNVN
ncbi:MAG: nucleotidyl transferase AbiEii/AbiGii toxin family protein [Bacteroidia bacterium]|nr:nucleotidyl transferase AbiEii/AbiGii toxin family protein [Bacteroidia bacterium]